MPSHSLIIPFLCKGYICHRSEPVRLSISYLTGVYRRCAVAGVGGGKLAEGGPDNGPIMISLSLAGAETGRSFTTGPPFSSGFRALPTAVCGRRPDE